MKSSLILLFAFCFSVTAFACIPAKSEFELSFFACKKDSDCVVTKDACRSCGEAQWGINKATAQKFVETDHEIRFKKNCMQACEACNQKLTKVNCVQNVCQVKKN